MEKKLFEKVTPMQVIIRPVQISDGNSITVDTNAQDTVSSVISAYCSKTGITFSSQLALFDGSKQLPQFQSLKAQGIDNGANLQIGYAKLSGSTQWPLFAALLALIAGIVCIIIISTLYGTSGGYPNDFGVVMDAGSSKTNTLLYSWKSKKLKGTGCVSQVNNCFAKGGIAKMEPTKIDKVIDCAKSITHNIDEASLPRTPLYFAATAGMRLLQLTNPEKAKQILFNVREQLNDTGLDVRDVGIITGQDEGTYGWITANFLQDTLEIPQKLEPWEPTTYGALDMGGASMQIAFAVPDGSKVSEPTEDLQLYGQTHHVFSHSNLCFGRDEAERRFRYFLVYKNMQESKVTDPCSPLGLSYNLTANDLFQQPCIENNDLKTYISQNPNIMKMTYQFSGSSSPNECRGNTSVLLDLDLCDRMKFKECFKKLDNIPSDQKYLAFASYFYTTDFLNVTKSTLREYDTATTQFCQKSYEDVKKISNTSFAHEYCFNARYIQEVLTTGFHFTNSTWSNLEFVGNIAGKDVGWPLGYMINATNLIPAKSEKPRIISAAAFGVTLAVFILIILATTCFIIIYYKKYKNRNILK